MVNLRDRGALFCGGSLISRTHVLTAAHCMEGRVRSQVTVHAGASTLSQSGITRQIAEVYTSGAYNTRTRHSDVAVLKLVSAINSTSVGTIGLCNTPIKRGVGLRVYGWGLIAENGVRPSNRLRTIRVPVIRRQRCRRQYRGVSRLTRTMFCAAALGRRDSCTGDSGGPAVANGRVCGIVSFGAGCARLNFPGVYTSVAAVREFINRSLTR
ncbi:seminase [Eurosta solidaginis]|uniref:seminase n=1 Tax=Eurosta solidaginis TaxID=178769 RepID=UPI003530A961